jgi:hypothetical protein
VALDPSRLKNAIKALTKTELVAKFGGGGDDLLPAEKVRLQDAFDELAEAIAFGDGPETVTEIVDNAETSTQVSGVTTGPSNLPNQPGTIS